MVWCMNMVGKCILGYESDRKCLDGVEWCNVL